MIYRSGRGAGLEEDVYDGVVMEPPRQAGVGPRIQYAKTEDGVSIAYWTMGEGEPPLVYMSQWPFEHCQREWQQPTYRALYEHFVKARRLIRFDGRGAGLSQREGADLSLDARLLDLEAVVGQLGLETFALCGNRSNGPVAIAYAVRHPERLSHLILGGTFAGVDYYQLPQVLALRSLIEADWEMATETIASVSFGWSSGEPARLFAAFLRECVTPEVATASIDARSTLDVTDLLSQIRTPTLVLQRRNDAFSTQEIARGLASRIPNAELSIVDYDRGTETDMHIPASAIAEFLGGPAPLPARTTTPELASDTAVILFADIVDSTALTERLGDAPFRELARELDGSLRNIIREHAGTPVEGKLLGDGVLAVFTSARQTIQAGLRCNAATQGGQLQLHVGIHAGDVSREDGNVYGGAVNIAARIADASPPGEVLVSQTVRDLARTSAGVSFEDRGEQRLKGIAEPLRLFAVRSRET